MSRYQIASAQTGSLFHVVMADSQDAALDEFARIYGFRNRVDMWDQGYFEYVVAYSMS